MYLLWYEKIYNMKRVTEKQSTLEKNLYEFIDVLKDAGVAISTDEVLALFSAVGEISLDAPLVFRQALQTTLIKDYTDIPIFEKCFNEFFRHVGVTVEEHMQKMKEQVQTREAAKKLRPLLEEKSEHLEIEINNFIEQMNESDLQLDSEQMLKLFLEELQQKSGTGGMGMSLFNLVKNYRDEGRPKQEGPNRQASQGEALEGLLLELIENKTSRRNLGTELRDREEYLMNKKLYQLTPEEIAEMREMIRRFGQKLKNRISLRKRRVKHGGIDIKKTFRTNLQYGGVPFKIFYKDRKVDRPQLVVLCDVSSSVNVYTRFMLLLTYTLQDLFSKVRTFAFISNLVEITDQFIGMEPERAINSIFDDSDFTYGFRSNYGQCFNTFIDEYSDSLTSKTSVLVLGDARNNYQKMGLNAFISIKERSRNVYWLNPEKEHLWDWGDSVATVYQKNCTEMKEVNSFYDLSDFIDMLF